MNGRFKVQPNFQVLKHSVRVLVIHVKKRSDTSQAKLHWVEETLIESCTPVATVYLLAIGDFDDIRYAIMKPTPEVGRATVSGGREPHAER